MQRELDISDLSPENLLDLAISVEEEARQRYLELENQMRKHHTTEAADFFHKMADFEYDHRERLHRIRVTRYDGEPAMPQLPTSLIDTEAPAYEEVRAFMSAHWALDVALAAEKKAEQFYATAADAVDDGELLTLLVALRDQERQHQLQVESFRETLPTRDTADPDDYVDPPRAQ